MSSEASAKASTPEAVEAEPAKSSPVGVTKKVIMKPASVAKVGKTPLVVPRFEASAQSSGSATSRIPKEPAYPPPKRLRMSEITIREAEQTAATPPESLIDEYSLAFHVQDPDSSNPQDAMLMAITGVFHLIGRANGKPIWKAEEQGTMNARFSPKDVAYIWWCETFAHWFITSIPCEEDWDSNAQIVYAMCEPDFRKVYSPWNDYVPNPKATITTLYDFTMSRMAQLQEYNHRLVIKDLQSHTLPPVASSAPEVAAPGPTDNDRYITLSTGEKLLKPPPAPGSKSAASDSSGLPPKYGFLPSLLKTGWKPKMVALITAFNMGLMDKVVALINRCLGSQIGY